MWVEANRRWPALFPAKRCVFGQRNFSSWHGTFHGGPLMGLQRREFGSAVRLWVRTIGIGACLAMSLAAQRGHAATLFSYDPSGGQVPTDQGWQAFEVD